ncbi:hypothetical protein [Nitrospirillum amazonense]|uniref:hypothetical protein n=1 Tax=Nitrospirillum amazonense TaxID=28077 RepID=UPI00119D43A4|nr:hypothetical protein [Nitrospirillum amazonense]
MPLGLKSGDAGAQLFQDGFSNDKVTSSVFRLADVEVGDQVGKWASGRVAHDYKMALPSWAVEGAPFTLAVLRQRPHF